MASRCWNITVGHDDDCRNNILLVGPQELGQKRPLVTCSINNKPVFFFNSPQLNFEGETLTHMHC